MLAGSILDLEPGTDYEVRLVLSDADGGAAEKIVTARTRTVPVAWDKAPIRHVVPGDGGGTGTVADPFRGLVAADAAAKPGDVFLLAPGTYKGGVVLKKKIGEPGKPIVYRGTDAEKTILDGQKKEEVVAAGACKHLFFENLTFTNARKGVSATGSEGLVIRGCHFHELSQIGIYAPANKGVNSRNAYIADNVIMGKASWVKGRKQSTYGILICGEGHVICYNRIENHWDGISLASHPDNRPMNRAIDIYGNDVRQCVDDGIEADKTYYNVRVFRNILVNCFSSISCQPGYGGPIYVLFNLIYNCTNKPFKFHVDPTGIVVAHNTCLTTREAFYGGGFHHAFFRNNLILGVRGEQGYWLSTQASQLDSDYNGYTDTGSRPLIKLNNVRYHDMAAFSAALGLERHSVQLGLETFVKAPPPPGQTVIAVPASFDLRLRPDSKAVDAGIHLPGINDGFAGKAPDLGCYELGRPLPAYGPRVARMP